MNFTMQCGENRLTHIANFETLIHKKNQYTTQDKIFEYTVSLPSIRLFYRVSRVYASSDELSSSELVEDCGD